MILNNTSFTVYYAQMKNYYLQINVTIWKTKKQQAKVQRTFSLLNSCSIIEYV